MTARPKLPTREVMDELIRALAREDKAARAQLRPWLRGEVTVSYMMPVVRRLITKMVHDGTPVANKTRLLMLDFAAAHGVQVRASERPKEEKLSGMRSMRATVEDWELMEAAAKQLKYPNVSAYIRAVATRHAEKVLNGEETEPVA